MKDIFFFLTLFLISTVAASPWYQRGKHHRHHHKKHPKHSSSLIESPSFTFTPSATAAGTSARSTVRSSSPSAAPSTGAAVPTANVQPSGTRSSKLSAPSAPATGVIRQPSAAGSSGTAALSAPATGVVRQPSASSGPTYTKNGTAPVAPTGVPRSWGTSASPSSTTSAAPAAGTPCSDFLRGVNIGGWLVLDSVLNAKQLSAAGATSQWSYDASPGSAEKLSDHWDTYFTEADIQSLKEYGVNAIKIPVGYWAWDNSGTPYKKGADTYLEKAISWAAAAGIKVWIDVSNTDTSDTRVAEASADYAMNHSLEILSKIATKYGAADYAATVVAIQIFDCPISAPKADAATHEAFTSKAYSTIRKASKNPNLQVIMPDPTSSPRDWIPTAQSCDSTKGMFAVAQSMSELSCPCEQQMTQKQHIQQACERGYNIAGLNHNSISIYVGDFNPATNATLHTEGWTEDVITDVRKYVEANLAVFEAYTSGYFFWSWAVDAQEVAGVGWGFKAGMEKGYIPKPLNDRSQFKYPGQCDV